MCIPSSALDNTTTTELALTCLRQGGEKGKNKWDYDYSTQYNEYKKHSYLK